MTIRGLVEAFGAAWARRDVDALMTFVTDDCVYGASVGPEPGATFVGTAEVRRGFEQMLRHDAGGTSREGRILVTGSVAVVEWAHVHVDASGVETSVRGCDIIEFRGDRIARKDAFRKTNGRT